ncbi:HNH endonuclease [Kitasatospora sp. RB6PN24]|uniref:HNH endonuclease signature motif containing protein n=1 Tax=Kitasatospora humi TaxID=2893891 RepID=UPI001E40A73A|nr:HNH endonuclease signature motif containing protein [Kitasatospora humi]MCC9308574.1 HNH endonuclease [Kitasatospora humi]
MSKPTRYTRELLSELAACSTSVSEMIRRLGVPQAGGTHSYLSRRLKHYGIDISHFEQSKATGPRQAYGRERLAAAAARSSSIGEMIRSLGVVPYDSLYGYLKQRVQQFGIDISHFDTGYPAEALAKTELAQVIASQLSLAGVLRSLGLDDTTTNRRKLKAAITQHGLDTSHFTGAGGANRGRPATNRRKPEELLVQRPRDAQRLHGPRLRRALLELGRLDACESCGIGPVWHGRSLTLEVDHINGDWSDNRPENLRLLCPNCHAITDTYCGRNRNLPLAS